MIAQDHVAGPDSAEGLQATRQYLTFALGNAEYGVEILKVQEVRGWDTATKVPNASGWICGVINLRGAIVPVVDLRLTFGLEASGFGPTTVVIVLRAQSEGTAPTVGIVVDAVSEVHNVPDAALQAAPEAADSVGAENVKGLATVDGQMLVLLDVDELIAHATSAEAVRPLPPAGAATIDDGSKETPANSRTHGGIASDTTRGAGQTPDERS